jgi:hypothetical protein
MAKRHEKRGVYIERELILFSFRVPHYSALIE